MSRPTTVLDVVFKSVRILLIVWTVYVFVVLWWLR
jgi:hypothetical protein